MKVQQHNSRTRRMKSQRGFTTAQMLVTLGLAAIISAFAVMSIGSARASVRLTGSTRELASYLEKARSNAVRRNGTSTVNVINATSYTVTMDFDGDGTVETRTIQLQPGVSFEAGMVGTVANFDWRGRVPIQIGFRLINDRNGQASINLSGAGDVTIGTEIFQDSAIGEVVLNSNPSTAVATGGGGGQPGASPSVSPSPSPSASPGYDASPSPTVEASPSASPSPTVTASPSPSPSASASPSASPGSSPSPGVCTLSAPSTLFLPKNSSPQTFSSVSIVNASSTVITASKSGDITGLTPGSTTVSGNGTISYTATYANGSNKSGTINISSSCGSKTITVTIN